MSLSYRSEAEAAAWLNPRHTGLAWTFTTQSLFKFLLTEGDKMVLASSATLYNQGVYGVASNYGISPVTANAPPLYKPDAFSVLLILQVGWLHGSCFSL